MARWLVIGSKGTIGTEIVKQLHFKGEEVAEFDLKLGQDINYHDDLFLAYEKAQPEYTILLAAVVGRERSEKFRINTLISNLIGTQKVIETNLHFHSKLVFISSSEAYGSDFYMSGKRPVHEEEQIQKSPMFKGIYGLSKNMGEKLVWFYELNYGLECVVVRPFMVYSGVKNKTNDQTAICKMMDSIMNNEEVIVHPGTSRSWCHVSDCAAGIIMASQKGRGLYNIGNNKEYVSAVDLSEKIGKICGKKKYKVRLEEHGHTIYPDKYFSTHNAENDLGWKPRIDLNTGLRLVYEERYS